MHIYRTCPKGEKTTGLGDSSLLSNSEDLDNAISYLLLLHTSVCMLHAKSLQMCLSPPGSLSMKFSRQECWSGFPCPPPRDPPRPPPKIEPESPVLAGGFFITSTTWEAPPTSTSLEIRNSCHCVHL